MEHTAKPGYDLRDAIGEESQAILDGFLRKRLYVAFMRPVRPLDESLASEINALLPQHWKWLIEQENQGHVFAAGPFVGEDGESYPGDGMFILQADSLVEAIEIVKKDPIVNSGWRNYDVRPWELNEGAMSLTIRFSNSKYTLR